MKHPETQGLLQIWVLEADGEGWALGGAPHSSPEWDPLGPWSPPSSVVMGHYVSADHNPTEIFKTKFFCANTSFSYGYIINFHNLIVELDKH